MKITEFLNYNKQCPICHEPLSLYFVWVDSSLFKSRQITPATFKFEPFKVREDSKNDVLASGNVTLVDDLVGMSLEFESNELRNYARSHQQYMFYICNPAGIKEQSMGQFEIIPYTSCYYRSTPYFQMQEGGGIDVVDPRHANIINAREIFCLSLKDKDVEKVYIASMEYKKQVTEFWHYSVSDEQKKEKFYKPNVLHKTLPLLPTGFQHIEDKEKLISRINTWVLMS